MSMMKNQKWVAPQRGMPVEDIGGSSARVSVSGETVSFFYSNSGTRTADAGQAAGTVVEAVLAYGPVANSSGDQVGNSLNSSLSFTSTAFTNEIRVSYEDLEELDGLTFANRLTKLQDIVQNIKTSQNGGTVTPMANGDYVVDYRHGILWGKKASTQTSLTSTAYKTLQKAVASGGSGSTASQVQGNTASGATDAGNPVKTGAVFNTSKPTVSSGQRVDTQADSNGNTYTRESYAPVAEDNAVGVYRVEQRFSYGRVTADGQIKGSAGFIHTVTFSATGTVTAGVITIYDNTAESGTVIWSGTIQTGLNPVTITLNVTTATGIYVGYDGTIANVATTVAYR